MLILNLFNLVGNIGSIRKFSAKDVEVNRSTLSCPFSISVAKYAAFAASMIASSIIVFQFDGFLGNPFGSKTFRTNHLD